MSGTPEERFWAKVDKNGPLWNGTPCWLWTASPNNKGYGKFWDGERLVLAHRFSYLLLKLIPDGCILDHLCRTPLCVNPAHLEPVTQRINILRGVGFCARHAQQTHCSHGHEYTPDNTYIEKKGKRSGGRHCITCRLKRSKTHRPGTFIPRL